MKVKRGPINRRGGLLLVFLLFCILITASGVHAKSNPKRTRSSKVSRAPTRRHHYEDFEEEQYESEIDSMDDYDDETEEDYLPKKSSRRKNSSPRAVYGRKGAMPQPRGHGRGSSSRALVKGRGRGPPPQPSVFTKLKDKAAAASDEASNKYKELARIAKGVVSSNYERFVLQITWPDDEPVPEVDFQDLLETFGRFPKAKAYDKQNNIYRATLRKLWARMTEKDWRTCVKAIYVLNRIARNATPRDSTMFSRELRSMSREVNPKSSEGYPYFNLAQLMDLSPTGQPYKEFISAYAIFAFRRVSKFTGRFSELAAVGPEVTEARAAQLLKDATLVIGIGLECKLNKQQLNPVTAQALSAVIKDMNDLWKATCKALDSVCAGKCKTQGKKARASEDEIEALLTFYTTNRPKVQAFLEENRHLLGDRRSRSLSCVNQELLDAKLAELAGEVAEEQQMQEGDGVDEEAEEDFEEEDDLEEDVDDVDEEFYSEDEDSEYYSDDELYSDDEDY
eukprot:CAMPEP_0117751992 /NCGR_PEP_ID=MMETSP0947-20121206/11329_1 /TAXON_ID=44440 /ORGANISM="Chattonella subsalsa, Strain CCMP2191" /LENGTH=507 /DNA_ID=CAMNT_0005570527 /DNA_START=38 /DNA_END=1561 /DNA_ORIENTATION=+